MWFPKNFCARDYNKWQRDLPNLRGLNFSKYSPYGEMEITTRQLDSALAGRFSGACHDPQLSQCHTAELTYGQQGESLP